jgi:hypothetical protein
MNVKEIIEIVRRCDRNCPSRSHHLDDIVVRGGLIRIRIRPKPDFLGEPKTLTLAVDSTESTDAIVLGMISTGYFTCLYQPASCAPTS